MGKTLLDTSPFRLVNSIQLWFRAARRFLCMPGDKLGRPSITDFLKSAVDQSSVELCPDCGLKLEHLHAAFFYDGQTWEIPLSFCARCDAVELSTAHP